MPLLKCHVAYQVDGIQVRCACVTLSQDMTGHLGVVPAVAPSPVGEGLLFRARAEREDGEPSDYWIDCRLVRIPPENLVEIKLHDEVPGIRPVLPFTEALDWPFAGDLSDFAAEATLQGDGPSGGEAEDEDVEDPYASPVEDGPASGAYVVQSDLLLGPGFGLSVVPAGGPTSSRSALGAGRGRPAGGRVGPSAPPSLGPAGRGAPLAGRGAGPPGIPRSGPGAGRAVPEPGRGRRGGPGGSGRVTMATLSQQLVDMASEQREVAHRVEALELRRAPEGLQLFAEDEAAPGAPLPEAPPAPLGAAPLSVGSPPFLAGSSGGVASGPHPLGYGSLGGVACGSRTPVPAPVLPPPG